MRRVLAVAAVTLALVGSASGALPPRKPLLVDPARQSVGAMRVGDPALTFAFGWAPPDYGLAADGGPVPEAFQSWRSPPNGPWAIVSFTGDDQQHASAIFYRGPFRTTKGDTNGTPLATVLAHWPGHGAPESASAPPLLRVAVGSSSFFFDAKRRLVAVQVGAGTASLWRNWRH